MKKLRFERKMDAIESGEYYLCCASSLGAAAIGAVGSIAGGLIGGNASKSAASTQAAAANNAAANQMAMFNKENENLAPFTALGTGSMPALISAMGYNGTYGANGQLTGMTKDPNSPLNQTFNFNPKDLQNYPGYQFALQQGLLGVNNSAAARGLGTSAADIKNASGYATGLASETYGNAYNQALNTFNTNYNTAANNAARVAGLVQTGQNSAALQANAGLTSAMNAGNFSTSGAAAQAAGQVGSANALTGAIGQGLNYSLMNKYINNMTDNTANTDSGW